VLRATGLVKSFRAPSGAPVPVLAGAELTAKGGEFVVIGGPSGSGKSTLLNVLGLLEDAEGGEVWYESERVSALGRNAKSRARARSVGFVFQSFLLLPALTALENVLRGPRRRRGAAARAGAPRRARRLAPDGALPAAALGRRAAARRVLPRRAQRPAAAPGRRADR
jgi:ABC-type lipoprotein export system ATPase subunit